MRQDVVAMVQGPPTPRSDSSCVCVCVWSDSVFIHDRWCKPLFLFPPIRLTAVFLSSLAQFDRIFLQKKKKVVKDRRVTCTHTHTHTLWDTHIHTHTLRKLDFLLPVRRCPGEKHWYTSLIICVCVPPDCACVLTSPSLKVDFQSQAVTMATLHAFALLR